MTALLPDGTVPNQSDQSGALVGSGAMFDAIAPRYDLLNRIISLGIDQSWRRKTIDALELSGAAEILDVATGTGDLAIRAAKRLPDTSVIGIDQSEQMLAIGRHKVDRQQLGSRVLLTSGDARSLPFEKHRFAGVTMAFGIRNVPEDERQSALSEIARVLKPGAKLALLELSEPRSGFFGPLARFHIRNVVPWVGGLVSGSREYRYLQRSIARFPPPATFAETISAAGFSHVELIPLTFGVACLYVAQTPVGKGHS